MLGEDVHIGESDCGKPHSQFPMKALMIGQTAGSTTPSLPLSCNSRQLISVVCPGKRTETNGLFTIFPGPQTSQGGFSPPIELLVGGEADGASPHSQGAAIEEVIFEQKAGSN